MSKTMLITGSTDGIGREAAARLIRKGHRVLLHGRDRGRLAATGEALRQPGDDAPVRGYLADLSDLDQVAAMANEIRREHDHLDVLINNAGVLRAPNPVTPQGWDLRLVVNTIAPYLLTRRLLPSLGPTGRVINVASAAQAPVDLAGLQGGGHYPDMAAYAQSKLALIMWTFHLARTMPQGPVFIAVNPGSLLGTKMVREGFGMTGKDLGIGADILVRLATADEFADASGRYFDNDQGRFGPPHPDALDEAQCRRLTAAFDAIIDQIG